MKRIADGSNHLRTAGMKKPRLSARSEQAGLFSNGEKNAVGVAVQSQARSA